MQHSAFDVNLPRTGGLCGVGGGARSCVAAGGACTVRRVHGRTRRRLRCCHHHWSPGTARQVCDCILTTVLAQ